VNKTQSATVGAILAAGILMRSTGPATPYLAPTHPGALAASVGAVDSSSSEAGPWIASCRYWEPARGMEPESPNLGGTLSVTLKANGYDLKTKKAYEVESEVREGIETGDAGCAPNGIGKEKGNADKVAGDSGARWGIPKKLAGGKNPQIRVIIAAVPDPVHTHLALEFDRSVDALVQAAGDNGYVPSYYWLPWKIHGGALNAETLASMVGSEKNSVKERQPGLIVFKYDPRKSDEVDYPWTSYSRAIYVFLVSYTPILGMDGAQLNRAFQYEADLAKVAPGIAFSMKPANDLAIIGPNSSGAAASLREGIESASCHLGTIFPSGISTVSIAGATSTSLADALFSYVLKPTKACGSSAAEVRYISFQENTHFETEQLKLLLKTSDYFENRLAILVEDGTVFGDVNSRSDINSPDCANKPEGSCPDGATDPSRNPVVIRFPRGISLLRNAHVDSTSQQSSESKSTPSPFLPFSLRDPGADDSIPQFSPEHTPLSQEAQLMAIGRQLQRNRAQFIVVIASDVLDQLFLSQFLHRACPDARLVFFGSDLLFERETQNAPFIGTLTFTAYPLTSLTSALGPTGPVRAFADFGTESYFNAASYTFWDGKLAPRLANYKNPFQPDSPQHASLWATAIGADGYYPLAIVNDCASDSMRILPTILTYPASEGCTPPNPEPESLRAPSVSLFEKIRLLFVFSDDYYKNRPYRYPALSWYVLCVVISLLCVVHSFAVSFPNYWSPYTRDLAIPQGDQRHRRAMYIHIGTIMLFCMAFVTAYPLFPTFRVLHPNWESAAYSLVAIGVAAAALALTIKKTWPYLKWRGAGKEINEVHSWQEKLRITLDKNLPWFFNLMAWIALALIPLLWIKICQTEAVNGRQSYVGLFFSYRCLHVESGVSPLAPVLLILIGWYIWAVCQTLRLRFSRKNRPCLPGNVKGTSPFPLHVSDGELASADGPLDSCLFSNISSLLITRDWFKRLIQRPALWLAPWLFLFYLLVFCLVVFVIRVQSLDRFLWNPNGFPTLYEFLVAGLFYPLIMIAMAGWLRVVLIWGSLKRGLLQPLEQKPIRYAFTRLKGTGWMAMMRQGGLSEQWLDMARSTESIRQMSHDPDLLASFPVGKAREREEIDLVSKKLNTEIEQLLAEIMQEKEDAEVKHLLDKLGKKGLDANGSQLLPRMNRKQVLEAMESIGGSPQAGLNHMHAIETQYGKFCDALLGGVLVPYWEETRTGLVESEGIEELPIKAHRMPKDEEASRLHNPLQLHTSSVAEEPVHIRVAEEFLAIRYVSLIRAVLVNMRYLIVFVSVVFVLMIVAWNSYPFQPRRWVDEAFTGLLLLLGTGIIWVFAQMHRDPILSRITDTNANELGLDFYLRVLTFGAAPVLTWLAYQFPEIGGSLFRLIQPSLQVMK
jgi:hypothetical protein